MVHFDSSAQGLLACSIVWVLVDGAAVALRLLAKNKTRSPLTLDDAWIFVAFALVTVYNAFQIRAIVAGSSSLDETHMSVSGLSPSLKYLYVADVFWPSAITAVKLSILSFYRRIFFTKKFRHLSMIVDALCLVWWIICTFILIFECSPVAAAWEVELQPIATCQPVAALVLGPELTNIVLDIVILCFPVQMIRNLNMPFRRKVLVSCVFVVGGLVCVVGILRMAILYRPKGEGHFSTEKAIILDTVEIGTALVCACLPIYRPLLPNEIPGLEKLTLWLSSLRSSRQRSQQTGRPSTKRSGAGEPMSLRVKSGDRKGYNQFDGRFPDENHFATAVGGDKVDGGYLVESEFPLHDITVQKTIDIV